MEELAEILKDKYPFAESLDWYNPILKCMKKAYNLGIKKAAQNANCYYNEENMEWEVDDKTILKQKLK